MDEVDEVKRRERFAEHFAGSGLAQAFHDARSGAAGDEDDGNGLAAGDFAQFAQDFLAAEAGHFIIQDYEVGARELGTFDEGCAVVEKPALDAVALEMHLIEFGDDEVIFRDKDIFHGRISRVMMVQSSARCGPESSWMRSRRCCQS